jgi:hypothetical protein
MAWVRVAFACTEDSDNADSFLAVPVWYEDDETAAEGLLPINQSINQSINRTTEQSTERAIEESEQSFDEL